MKIIRAQHYGMCFGVRDAIEMAEEHSKGQTLTILGDLVHNDQVMGKLRETGITVERDLAQVKTHKVMITAHGASEKRISEVRAKGHEVIEATCPLVKHAHRSIVKLAERGYYPVIIGKRDHVEVVGLTEDLEECTVIESMDEIRSIPMHGKIGVASQTTQPISKVLMMVEAIRKAFRESEVRFTDTVCRPTKERQLAADQLAGQCDTIMVVGGTNSNNTRQLVEKCATHGARVWHIQNAGDIRSEWLAEAKVVGITAGTSTPLALVDEVEERLESLALIMGPKKNSADSRVLAGS